MARPKEHGKPIGGFSGVFYEEDQDTVDKMEDLRSKDKLDKGPFVKKALTEYVTRHSPGNPTIPLDHWTTDQELSEAAREKLTPKEAHHIEVDCSECSGSGENRWGGSCRGCNGIGKVGVEKSF